ncbi:MAG: hypothetical protein NC087_10270 [Anaeroplasma bactoclasticum]|nr:hypothetical protein [Anaeroplasma bactoclasticum]
MLTLSDLVLYANSDVWIAVYDSDGELLIEGYRDDLENDCNLNLQVDNYWIDDETLHVHVLKEGEV